MPPKKSIARLVDVGGPVAVKELFACPSTSYWGVPQIALVVRYCDLLARPLPLLRGSWFRRIGVGWTTKTGHRLVHDINQVWVIDAPAIDKSSTEIGLHLVISCLLFQVG